MKIRHERKIVKKKKNGLRSREESERFEDWIKEKRQKRSQVLDEPYSLPV